MDTKLIAIFLGFTVFAFCIGFFISPLFNNEGIEIANQQDLSNVVDDLSEEMYYSKKFLSNVDISKLMGSDRNVNFIILFPNDMTTNSMGYGVDSKSKHFEKHFENGTRLYTEISYNGTILKDIKIYDVPKKTITIIIKE